jgi:hypothetical protein
MSPHSIFTSSKVAAATRLPYDDSSGSLLAKRVALAKADRADA